MVSTRPKRRAAAVAERRFAADQSDEEEGSSSPPPPKKSAASSSRQGPEPAKTHVEDPTNPGFYDDGEPLTDTEMADESGEARSEKLCASSAMSEYKVTNKMLLSLPHESRTNPHYSSAAPMRLYLRVAVIRMARKMRREKRWKEEHAEELEAARQAAARARACQAAEAARSVVGSFKRQAVEATDSGLSTAWRLVFPYLAEDVCHDLGPGSFCGTSVVLRRFLNLAATCKELRHAVSTEGLPILAEKVPPQAWQLYMAKPGCPDKYIGILRQVTQDPSSCRAADLQVVAGMAGLKKSGTKAELILRLLNLLGIHQPKPVPPELLLAIKKEKYTPQGFTKEELGILSRNPDDLTKLQQLQSRGSTHTVFLLRKHIESRFRVCDEAGWRQLLGKFLQIRQAELAEEARVRMATRQQLLAEQQQRLAEWRDTERQRREAALQAQAADLQRRQELAPWLQRMAAWRQQWMRSRAGDGQQGARHWQLMWRAEEEEGQRLAQELGLQLAPGPGAEKLAQAGAMPPPSWGPLEQACVCGSTAAKMCARGLCRNCCQRYSIDRLICLRHNTGLMPPAAAAAAPSQAVEEPPAAAPEVKAEPEASSAPRGEAVQASTALAGASGEPGVAAVKEEPMPAVEQE